MSDRWFTTRRADALTLLLLAALVGLGAYGVANLSGEVAVQFGTDGEVTNQLPVLQGMALLPAVGVLVALGFKLWPVLDPLGTSYESFRGAYDGLMVFVVGVLVYAQAAVLAWNLGYRAETLVVAAPLVAVTYFVSGMVVKRATRNWFVGIQTPWTMSDERVWDRTHAVGGLVLQVAAPVPLAALVLSEYGTALLVAPGVAVALFGFVYSFVVYRRLPDAGSDPS